MGDLAQPGQTLVSLYNPDLLQVEGEVNDSYRDQVKIGEIALVSVPAVKFEAQLPLAEIFPISAAGQPHLQGAHRHAPEPGPDAGDVRPPGVCPWGTAGAC